METGHTPNEFPFSSAAAAELLAVPLTYATSSDGRQVVFTTMPPSGGGGGGSTTPLPLMADPSGLLEALKQDAFVAVDTFDGFAGAPDAVAASSRPTTTYQSSQEMPLSAELAQAVTELQLQQYVAHQEPQEHQESHQEQETAALERPSLVEVVHRAIESPCFICDTSTTSGLVEIFGEANVLAASKTPVCVKLECLLDCTLVAEAVHSDVICVRCLRRLEAVDAVDFQRKELARRSRRLGGGLRRRFRRTARRHRLAWPGSPGGAAPAADKETDMDTETGSATDMEEVEENVAASMEANTSANRVGDCGLEPLTVCSSDPLADCDLKSVPDCDLKSMPDCGLKPVPDCGAEGTDRDEDRERAGKEESETMLPDREASPEPCIEEREGANKASTRRLRKAQAAPSPSDVQACAQDDWSPPGSPLSGDPLDTDDPDDLPLARPRKTRKAAAATKKRTGSKARYKLQVADPRNPGRTKTKYVYDPSHACDVCGKTFTWRAHLAKHAQTHTGERSLHCHICGQTFRWSSHLTSHLRRHNDEKPYECQQCGKRFLSGHVFKGHMRTHTDEKPYMCSVCGKQFRDKSNLRTHEWTHSDTRPHHCELCERGFLTSSALRAHNRTAHGVGAKPAQ